MFSNICYFFCTYRQKSVFLHLRTKNNANHETTENIKVDNQQRECIT